ncbi:MAG: Wzz/FepE/Etk N-terminal domain-containing protein [Planctomycetota bacterium]|nr:Wzz/FepE/Etk N-terminal domain-containing protein [Planctomycetota bacterium]
MAVEVENTSQVEELLRVLKRRLWWILIPAGIIAILGVSYAIVVPKKYVATAQVMVFDRPTTAVRGSISNTAEGRVAPHKLKAPQRVRSVLDKLKWLEYEELPTEVEAAAYRASIIKNITVNVPVMESNVQQQLVKIKFSHTRVDLAEQFLFELVRQWQHEVLDKAKRSLTDESDQLIAEQADLEKEREEHMATLLRLRRDNRIPPKTNNRSGNDMPQSIPAFEEVRRLQRRLNEARVEHEEWAEELDRMRAQERRMPDMVPRPGSGGGDTGERQLERLHKQLEDEQNRLAEGGWGPSHSAYKRAQSKIAKLRAKIEQAMGVAPERDNFEYVQPNANKQAAQDIIALGEEKLRRLAGAITTTDSKLVEAEKMASSLQKVYSQIGQKEFEMSKVEAGLKTVSQNLLKVRNKLAIQSGPLGYPFDDLEKVTASDEPEEPNAWLISTFSIVLGLGVGLGLAVALEFSKNCFRSINDIARSMEIPVLGAINRIETRRQRHVKRVQKLVVSLCMLLSMGVVGFTLWAWALHPHLLKASVVESIDRLREVLG